MTGNTIETRLRSYYASESLDPEFLDSLKLSVRVTERERPRQATWAPLLTSAAILIVAFSLGWFVSSGSRSGRPDLERTVAAEVAVNHNKQLTSDYLVSSYGDLHQAMGKLDFAPFEPDRVRRAGHRLIGARYCAIGGQIAVQIRLTDARGRPLTLYEFRPGTRFARIGQAEITIDGVDVSVWTEAGLVLGLAAQRN